MRLQLYVYWLQAILRVMYKKLLYGSVSINPALGGISPRDMIRFGRYHKLEKFVRNALAGNVP